jgi:hypothetical protein
VQGKSRLIANIIAICAGLKAILIRPLCAGQCTR